MASISSVLLNSEPNIFWGEINNCFIAQILRRALETKTSRIKKVQVYIALFKKKPFQNNELISIFLVLGFVPQNLASPITYVDAIFVTKQPCV